MNEAARIELEAVLSRHYAAQRGKPASEQVERLATLMVAEDARARKAQPRSRGAVAFVAAQVRYVPAWTWAAQAVLVALMCAMAYASGNSYATKVAVGALSAMSVLVGLPTVHASKRHGMAELEYACANNTASVVIARLIVMGCSSSLAVALMVGAAATALDTGAFSVALWACPPFFCSCAGTFALLRRANPYATTTMSVAWATTCSAALLAVAIAFPEAYGDASLAVWAGASCVAALWLAREVALTIRAAAAGLDAFCPHMAKTCN